MAQRRGLGSVVTVRESFTVRAARWSATHRRLAVFGWLAFVIAAFMIGSAAGMVTLKAGEGENGQSRLADQTLAQLLLNRALTDDEAREMLPPLLDALAFLHGRNLLQGQLKPSNVLVVGDQLKLASDTVRRASEAPMSTSNPTVYDPPEARHGASSTAGDIWALGVSLFEALTRRQPSGLGEPREVVLPGDFSPTFRDVVARCLLSLIHI